MSAEQFGRNKRMGNIGSAPERVRKAALEAHRTGDDKKLKRMASNGGKVSGRRRQKATESEAERIARIVASDDAAARKAHEAYGDEPPPWLRD